MLPSPKTAIRRIGPGEALPEELRGAVVAIGNFDGVHRGHRAVLDRALAIALDRKAQAAVLTFEPHPRTFFKPEAPVFRLTPAAMKARLLGHLGFGSVIECAFDKHFAAQGAEDFIASVLIGRLGVGHVVTGVDFHFGKGREGGPAYLIEAGARHGFGVTLVDAFRDENATIISSSRIRSLIAEGDVVEAAGLLGYRFTVEGKVIAGRQLGRTLGYPTANMLLAPDMALKPGIYAVRYRRADGTLHDGVASFGHRPTVESDGTPLLETYLFDFDGDLYGEIASVAFFGFLRPEEKFDGLAALVEQMKEDEMQARALLSGVRPLEDLDRVLNF
ncbi:bifunctional riboflavin kinase/FAD synthetase [Pararhizobium haloflavum]|uniref:bifunctional riboflavin kinase/FAD synthetase n=1 Tax=Pararhizobium haloflavum TaxID=2037914 RepID=UPI000C19F80F|nr:bifunctional riboflavin kinase/FAD synthetase [Pararhizobium haloflavum]